MFRFNPPIQPLGTVVLLCSLTLPAYAHPPSLPAPAPPPAVVPQRDISCAEAAFLQENAVAMEKMMADMDVPPSGDVDRDFVAMMVPHHQGAIDMARLVLRHGRNERIRRMAQEIIVTQQQEIVAMQMAVDSSDGLASSATHEPREPGPSHHDHGARIESLENCP